MMGVLPQLPEPPQLRSGNGEDQRSVCWQPEEGSDAEQHNGDLVYGCRSAMLSMLCGSQILARLGAGQLGRFADFGVGAWM